jgi:23S rRNA (cytosine1962-C5)-methyltransferase
VKRIILKKGEEDRILAGHPWVYANEVETVLAAPDKGGAVGASGAKAGAAPAKKAVLEAGECADVESAAPKGKSHGAYLGRAVVNPASQIIARIYSRSKEGLDKGFFKRRFREAAALRALAGYDLGRESARLVFAEADFLPGLIVDSFAGLPADKLVQAAPFHSANLSLWLSVQFLTWGMDCRRDMIVEALEEVFRPAAIVERFAPVRELEGLPNAEGGRVLRGGLPGKAVIFEGGLPFYADLAGGQKTGHFLDQRDNRRAAAKAAAAFYRESIRQGEAAGGVFKVLDCFCYTGGFAVNIGRALSAVPAVSVPAVAAAGAAAVGAARAQAPAAGAAGAQAAAVEAAATGARFSITAVDESEAALALAAGNAALNGSGSVTLT